jgi:hypothetical protein
MRVVQLALVIAKEVCETRAAIGERELQFGLVPTELCRLSAKFWAQLVDYESR